MNKHSKGYAVLSDITWIGRVIAYLARDPEDTLVCRHLNQALVLNLIETAGRLFDRFGGIISTVSNVVGLAMLVFFIMGIVRAARMSEEPLPLIGDITLIQ